MAPQTVACPKCKSPLPEEAWTFEESQDVLCRACGSPLAVQVFPALFRPAEASSVGEAVVVEGEASCFYHAAKRAVTSCEACGRFLCALCDVELNGAHLCPNCLDSGRKKGKLTNLQNHRVLYDSFALALAIAPLLVWPITCITAPVAVFYAVRYWNAPSSLIPRTRVRALLAIIIGLLEIGGWGIFIYHLANS